MKDAKKIEKIPGLDSIDTVVESGPNIESPDAVSDGDYRRSDLGIDYNPDSSDYVGGHFMG
tara:strand:+ start:342 stop:524 length:183 start_codon:yes stop_codon:yes gene_type:complete